MSLFDHLAPSNLFTIPPGNHRHYPTFFISIVIINLLAAIFWWHSSLTILILIPLASMFLPLGIKSSFIFFGMAIYCTIISHHYKKTQQTLLERPQEGRGVVQEISYNKFKNNYRITFSFLPTESNCPCTIQLFLKECPIIKAGDELEIKNLIFKEVSSSSYRNYLLKESIHAVTYCHKLNYKIVNHTVSLISLATRALEDVEKRLSKKLSSSAEFLFGSLFLGSKKYLAPTKFSIKNYFNTWGINHFLARSGLHVSLLLFLIISITRLFQFSLWYSNAMTVVFLVLYIFLSYPSISFTRAVLVAFFGIWCLLLKVPSNLLHLLALALVILILYNPFSALFLDFQLTFLLTGGLCIISLLISYP